MTKRHKKRKWNNLNKYKLKEILKFSCVVLGMLLLSIYASFYFNSEYLFLVSVPFYLLFGLITSTVIFIKIQRKYKYRGNQIEFRIMAIAGAVFVGVVMFILVYPIHLLLQKGL